MYRLEYDTTTVNREVKYQLIGKLKGSKRVSVNENLLTAGSKRSSPVQSFRRVLAGLFACGFLWSGMPHLLVRSASSGSLFPPLETSGYDLAFSTSRNDTININNEFLREWVPSQVSNT